MRNGFILGVISTVLIVDGVLFGEIDNKSLPPMNGQNQIAPQCRAQFSFDVGYVYWKATEVRNFFLDAINLLPTDIEALSTSSEIPQERTYYPKNKYSSGFSSN